ncbi:Polysaccharide ABC transporter, ATP-binding protein [Corynebacterium camporealensis]|uniref:ABC transporter n=1 Tax=Corynebacterium camporealensis TaxID=161896 RepID=A0A0F6QZG3_9CORY|nr:ABC transporter [Corynebacterium camporealensis]AVH88937.1 Polysaccharide ABC transporter, ATP-binding protein [Corynebacterium camporealensis]
MTIVLEAEGLSKKYDGSDFFSLKDVNFRIEEGDIVGLVGRNGSGKSTLLKMLAKSQRPTSGRVLYRSEDLHARPDMLKDFSLMIEPAFFPQLSVEQNLDIFLRIHRRSDM